MLRVTIELVPHGIASKAQTIGRIDIENVGQKTPEIYQYAASVKVGDEKRQVFVDHVRKLNVLYLLRRVIDAAIQSKVWRNYLDAE